MFRQFESSVVQIFNSSNKIVGTGFLVSEQHILTCAHVVQTALSLEQISKIQKGDKLQVGFPRVAPGKTYNTQVIFWQYDRSSTNLPPADKQDIAVLELENIAPNGVKPVKLATTEDWWEHSFRVFGFPGGVPNGRWARGELLSILGDRSVQIESINNQGYPIVEGFSGAPIWDDTLKSVVGMVIQRDKNPNTKAAFIIPTSSLVEAYPQLITLGAVTQYPKMYVDIDKDSSKATVYLPNSYLDRLIQEILHNHENLAINGEALPIKRTWYQEVDLANMSLVMTENQFKINGSWNFRFREKFPPLHNWMPKRGEFSKQFVIGVENGRLALRESEYQLAVVSGENQMSDFVYGYPKIQNGLETAINEFVDRKLIPIIRQELESLDIRHIIINCMQDEVPSSLETMQQELRNFLEQSINSVSGRVIEGGLIITLQ
ncbi:MAG TPA: hypothetical protein DDW51_02950 [Cyanobacteria bacterium UBA11367]|nr:hypothetical protein [Cyanobacteria bacterium UBA11367]